MLNKGQCIFILPWRYYLLISMILYSIPIRIMKTFMATGLTDNHLMSIASFDTLTYLIYILTISLKVKANDPSQPGSFQHKFLTDINITRLASTDV